MGVPVGHESPRRGSRPAAGSRRAAGRARRHTCRSAPGHRTVRDGFRARPAARALRRPAAGPGGPVPASHPVGEELEPLVREAVRAVHSVSDHPGGFGPARDRRTFTVLAGDCVTLLLLRPLVARLSEKAPLRRIDVMPFLAHRPLRGAARPGHRHRNRARKDHTGTGRLYGGSDRRDAVQRDSIVRRIRDCNPGISPHRARQQLGLKVAAQYA